MLLERIAAGERPDLVLGVSSSVTDLAEQGLVDPAQVAEIAVSSVGFARLEGARVPADDSAAAFLDYLLAARAVAYTLSGASGVHFMKVLGSAVFSSASMSVPFAASRVSPWKRCSTGGRMSRSSRSASCRSVVGPQIVEPIPHDLQSYGRFAIGARPGAGDDAARFVTPPDREVDAGRVRRVRAVASLTPYLESTHEKSHRSTPTPAWMTRWR